MLIFQSPRLDGIHYWGTAHEMGRLSPFVSSHYPYVFINDKLNYASIHNGSLGMGRMVLPKNWSV